MSRYFFLFSAIALTLLTGCSKQQLLTETRELHSNWEFRQADKTVWLPASVPGCVHTDLMAAGLIDDPFFRSNEDSVQWIGEKDWVYRSSFNISRADLATPRIDLVFEGLDTHAKVKLNGQAILAADNMFRTWTTEVKELLTEGENSLEIHFRSPQQYNEEKAAELSYVLPEDERVHSRKAQYQFGWDWGPKLVTSGIWRPVYLQLHKGPHMRDLFVRAQEITNAKATYLASLEVDAIESGKAIVTISSPTNKFKKETKTIHLNKGNNEVALQFAINNPELWWPNGMGNQPLYDVDITLKSNQGTQTIRKRIGVRTIELVQTPDQYGSSFEFHVNGIPFFAKGANFIPLESFPSRLTYKDYEDAIVDAVKANYNMLRIWGGGIYEDDAFYDLCDEHGILVWQDFMFACAMYPGDEPFLNNVREEVMQVVKKLRNHTSIALWCGNNEIQNGWFDWGWQNKFGYSAQDSLEVWGHYEKVFHEIIPQILEKEDPTRQYWPSSPSYGWGHKEATTMGDNHYWGVWWGKEPFEMYRKRVSRFMSEFGFQSFPDWSTIKTFTLPEDRHLWSSVMRTHQKHPIGNETIDEYMKRWYPEPKDFESYVYVSQILQAEGMMIGIAAHRQAMPYSMGTLYWQFNDCWPVASWSSRDYYGNWKAMHYYVRKAFDNLFLSPLEENGQLSLFLISDLTESSAAEMKISLFDFEGNRLKEIVKPIEIKTNSHLVFESPVKELLAGASAKSSVMKAELMQNGSLLADCHHFFDLPKNLALKPVVVEAKTEKSAKGYEVTVSADYLARHVLLSVDGVSGWWSNNYFDLIPGESQTVTFETNESIADFEKRLRIVSLADAF
ncbi:beta-mannosidase [Alkaliflexus imshenetskii]|uniref:beta-mannosidase n=1 Tax=Alkaliflexus imshenetskii TaxID=286730 RepID=UPI00047B61E5|nr:glycoside hydrolase family 2 protein [Alkaliflexus imshenetskii]